MHDLPTEKSACIGGNDMYETINNLPQPQQIEVLAKELVQIPSVNSSAHGEVDICRRVAEILSSFPYFQEHPDLVWETPLLNDPLQRSNVFAFLPKADSKKIVLLHAHIDTVGIEDFGKQKADAFSPERLLRFFENYEADADVQSDALSGEWAFGRGMLDMKSGMAVHLANLLHYSLNPQELPFNLLLMGNPVEENDHTGVIAALPELLAFKRKGYEFIVAVNTDFVSPLFEGDDTRYLYTGAAGKILPCFYIKGRETHVGSTLQGIDPTLLSSAINLAINTNSDLCELIDDEEVLPSSALQQRDCKDFYNVQTAKVAHLYFNTFLYERSVTDVLTVLRSAAEEAVRQVTDKLDARLAEYRARVGVPIGTIEHEVTVLLFEDYLRECSQKGVDTAAIIEENLEKYGQEDKRAFGFRVVDALEHATGDDAAKVILFLAPPFCPHNGIEPDSPVDHAISAAMEKIGAEHGQTFKKRRFFPFLSDSSYLSMSETKEEILTLIQNFPGMESIYPLPTDDIQELSIPAVNLGVYGKGAHTWKERVYKPYSYEVLPRLIREVIVHLSREERNLEVSRDKRLSGSLGKP